jgi:hypothetical protein
VLYQKVPQKKKFRNEDLPRGCQDDNRWRRNFIPTFLWYAAYQTDPWNLEEDAAVDAMQQIWNQLYGKAIPYRIMTHDAVYIIVRAFMFVFSFSELLYLHHFIKTLQRVSDSWRNTIGSAANTGLTAFFESNEGFDTDLSRQEFATDQLTNAKFLYSDTQGPGVGAFNMMSLAFAKHIIRNSWDYFAANSLFKLLQPIIQSSAVQSKSSPWTLMLSKGCHSLPLVFRLLRYSSIFCHFDS